ncbi:MULTISPECIES: hypothetical protein [unclassified Streptomyces]|uniref:hypothetical protein n=1 Tax=unclassified Streptomyces TaxID=2593676 RepID=UPI0006FD28E2|nr:MULTISPECIES: hypothetical protein [unclassified Streptomyces]KQX57478.1 hypothetical protein ASD33_27715 [Streptomyces sp. Root1304]KRA98850.1 hypothetical protein ASE09_24525 [Streptomyces sp. Root66D1]
MTSDERGHDGLEEALRAALRSESTARPDPGVRPDPAVRAERPGGAGDITGAGAVVGPEGLGAPSASGAPGALGGEAAALAAFRAARDAGLHGTRPTRRRDDWAPGGVRRIRRRSLRTTLAALLASVTLGGVAIAAVDLPRRFDDEPASVPSTPVPAYDGGTVKPSGGTTPSDATPAPASSAGRPAPLPAVEGRDPCHGRAAEKAAKGRTEAEAKGGPPKTAPCHEQGRGHVPAYPGQGDGPGKGPTGAPGSAPGGARKAVPKAVPGAELRPVPGHIAEKAARGPQQALNRAHVETHAQHIPFT